MSKFILCFVNFSFIHLSLGQIDVEHDAKLRKLGIKCGVKGKISANSDAIQSRIVNGEAISFQKYPWLAAVFLKTPTTKKTYEETKEMWTMDTCGGTIISERSILTAIHCVCNPVSPFTESGEDMETCLAPNQCTKGDSKSCLQINQNRENENEVFYTIGTQVTEEPDYVFNEEISVYIYKYDPQWTKQSDPNIDYIYWLKNGDIAIIKNTSPAGLDLKRYSVSPICLPSPRIFEQKIDHITIAGKGVRYHSTDDNHLPPFLYPLPFTSCYTNEALLKDSKKYPTKRSVFLQCEGDPEYNTACVQWDDVVIDGKGSMGVNSISTNVQVKFSFSPVSIDAELTLDKDDKCSQYWEKAEKLIAEQPILSNGPSITQHRIVIIKAASKYEFEKIGNRWNWNIDTMARKKVRRKLGLVKICYNVKKVAKYGICKTKSASNTPYGWGFCSRSCEHAQFSNWEEFEEIKVIYNETPPKNTFFTYSFGN